jgi:hypothetical protein
VSETIMERAPTPPVSDLNELPLDTRNDSLVYKIAFSRSSTCEFRKAASPATTIAPPDPRNDLRHPQGE